MRDGTFGKHKRRRKESQHAQEPALGEFSAMISSEQGLHALNACFFSLYLNWKNKCLINLL